MPTVHWGALIDACSPWFCNFRRCARFCALAIVTAGYAGSQAAAQSPSPSPATITFEALVSPESQIDLASPAEGVVTEVLVKEGARVEAKDPLVRLNSEEEKIRLKNSELLAQQLAEDAEALKRLYEGKAASRDDLNRATLQAQQAAAERDLLAIRLRDRTISSPIGGSILRIFKEPGESVQRLEKVAEVVALDHKYLTGFLDASLFGTVKPGMRAEVGAARLQGLVEVVDPVLDPGGKVFRIKIFVKDPGGALAVGTRVPVELRR